MDDKDVVDCMAFDEMTGSLGIFGERMVVSSLSVT
jgi:hypothetical protein